MLKKDAENAGDAPLPSPWPVSVIAAYDRNLTDGSVSSLCTPIEEEPAIKYYNWIVNDSNYQCSCSVHSVA